MDKKAVAEGLAWFFGLIVIIIILAIFVFIATPLASTFNLNAYGTNNIYVQSNVFKTNADIVSSLTPSFIPVRDAYDAEYLLSSSSADIFNPATNAVFQNNGAALRDLFFSVLSSTYNFNLDEFNKLSSIDQANKNLCFGIGYSGMSLGVFLTSSRSSTSSFATAGGVASISQGANFLPSRSGIFLKTKDKATFSLFGITLNDCTGGETL